jgi:hypothetical protein
MAKATAGNVEKAQAEQVWSMIETKAAWDALTVAEQREIMRRVMKFMVGERFPWLKNS